MSVSDDVMSVTVMVIPVGRVAATVSVTCSTGIEAQALVFEGSKPRADHAGEQMIREKCPGLIEKALEIATSLHRPVKGCPCCHRSDDAQSEGSGEVTPTPGEGQA